MGQTDCVKTFLVTQQFDASSDAVHAAYLDHGTWKRFGGLPFVGDPVVDSFVAGDPTTIATSYRVMINLPALAATFIDAEKMTFVEVTRLHADGTGTFEIVPDHYAELLTSAGRIEMVPFDDRRCERLVQGHVSLNLGWAGKLFEAPVEEAIVKGLKEALSAQAAQVLIE